MGRRDRSADAGAIVLDYRTANLTPPERALCDFAVRLTLRPQEMGRDDIDALRAHGFDDAQVTIAVQVIAYFNYINRVADALGVDPEPWMTMPREEWLARKARDWA